MLGRPSAPRRCHPGRGNRSARYASAGTRTARRVRGSISAVPGGVSPAKKASAHASSLASPAIVGRSSAPPGCDLNVGQTQRLASSMLTYWNGTPRNVWAIGLLHHAVYRFAVLLRRRTFLFRRFVLCGLRALRWGKVFVRGVLWGCPAGSLIAVSLGQRLVAERVVPRLVARR